MRTKLGWRPETPDQRDLKYRANFSVAPIGRLPAEADHRPRCAPVRDQADCNGCVGFSAASAVEYLRRIDAERFDTVYSPLFLYYEARKRQGWQKIDDGSQIRDAVKTLVKIGVPPESRWPFAMPRVNRMPNASAYRDASRWRLAANYYRLDSLAEILSALRAGHAVLGGIVLYSNLGAADRTGDIALPRTKDEPLGGHALHWTGFSTETRRVYFKNSWGTKWGRGGYGSVPFAYLDTRDLADDFWALVREQRT